LKKRLSILLIFIFFPTLVVGNNFGYKMVTIKTQPSGARLFLNGKSIGESPATIRVQDGMLAPQYMIRIELEGYSTQLSPLDQHWIPGMTIIGGCCGILFMPMFGILIYAKEHHPIYTFYLQKN